MGIGLGWAVALLVAAAALALAGGIAFHRRTARTLPFVLAVGAGIATVALVVVVVGVVVLR